MGGQVILALLLALSSVADTFNMPQDLTALGDMEYVRFIFTRSHPDFGVDTSWANGIVYEPIPGTDLCNRIEFKIAMGVTYYDYHGWTDYLAMARQFIRQAHPAGAQDTNEEATQ